VNKNVFHEIGLFDESQQTGGDVDFVQKATSMGYKLIYSPKAKVYHKSRDTFSEILDKLYRFTNDNKYKTKLQKFVSLGLFPGIKIINKAYIKKRINITNYIKLVLFSFVIGLSVCKKLIMD